MDSPPAVRPRRDPGDAASRRRLTTSSDWPGARRPITVSHHIVPLVSQPGFAAERRLGADRHGNVERSSNLDAEEAARRDANHVHRLTVDHERAADRGGISAELSLPEAVAHHRIRHGATGAVVVTHQETTDVGIDSEHGEEVAADEQSLATRRPLLRSSRNSAFAHADTPENSA